MTLKQKCPPPKNQKAETKQTAGAEEELLGWKCKSLEDPNSTEEGQDKKSVGQENIMGWVMSHITFHLHQMHLKY